MLLWPGNIIVLQQQGWPGLVNGGGAAVEGCWLAALVGRHGLQLGGSAAVACVRRARRRAGLRRCQHVGCTAACDVVGLRRC